MNKDYEITYHDVEKRHWWFKSRREYILKLIKNIPLDSKILDIGCSSGIFMIDLINNGYKKENLFGVDISEKAILNSKANGLLNTYVMDAQNISLNEKFDLIVASDCLEHLKMDELALVNWVELLKPGGILIVFVPAFHALWSYHDELNMHFRRYTKKELIDKINKLNNVTIKKSGYWNFFLFIPVLIFRKLNQLLVSKQNIANDIKMPNKVTNSLFYYLIKFENKLLSYTAFPFGISTFSIIKKN